MHKPRVILADDHTLLRQGLALLLPKDMELVGSVSNGNELLEAARRLRPDLIIADLTMPELGGVQALRRLRSEGIDARFVVLTVHVEPALAVEALRAGALGYVVKQAAGEELQHAIRCALAGRTFISPMLSDEAVRQLAAGRSSPGEALTPRQREVVRLLAEGRRVKEIAAQLGLSVRTVESHKYEVMNQLALGSTVDLVKFAIRQGIVAL